MTETMQQIIFILLILLGIFSIYQIYKISKTKRIILNLLNYYKILDEMLLVDELSQEEIEEIYELKIDILKKIEIIQEDYF